LFPEQSIDERTPDSAFSPVRLLPLCFAENLHQPAGDGEGRSVWK